MQKPSDFTQNLLLSHTIRFLHKEEDNFDNIKVLLERSSINHLALTFSFLIKWLSNHLVDESMTETYNDTIQSVFQLISLILQKVPPVILYHLLPENVIESSDCSHWLINELLEPIKKRIIKLRSYIKPHDAYDTLCLIPCVFHQGNGSEIKLNGADKILRIDKNTNIDYESIMLKYMKYLIMNHLPVQSFKFLTSLQNSRLILTKVIIQILEELNQARKATHEELLFAFSNIFLYIYAFAYNNEIDGQILSRYLRSRSFLSPFCLLGMVKYIISYLYLYNLLTPIQYITENTNETLDDTKIQPYTFVDLTNDKTLTPLIQKIPLILANYFFTKTTKKDETNPNSKHQLDDSSFFIFLHLSNIEFRTKMQTVLLRAKDQILSPAHVYSMGLLLLRYIIFSLQHTLVGCVEKDMFTPNFSVFVKTIFSILTTTFCEQLSTKFFDLPPFDPKTDNAAKKENIVKTINITLGGAFLHLLPIIFRNPTNDSIIKYCLKAINDKDTAQCGRIMIAKMLLCDSPKISPSLINSIKETKDIVTLLNYINAFTSFKRYRDFKEANKLEESRINLLNQLIIGNNYNNENNNFEENKFIFRPFKALSTIGRPFNSLSTLIIKAFESTNQMNSLEELLCNSAEEDQPYILVFFSLTPCIENESFAETITYKIVNELNRKEQKQIRENRFELSKNDHFYTCSQSLLARLVSFSYSKLAVKLSQAMIPFLIKDTVALHYITSFLSKYRQICPVGVLESFSQVIPNLPCADEYYEPCRFPESTTLSFSPANHSILINRVFAITEMLEENICKIIQKPEIIVQEYQSPFQNVMAFAICNLALTTPNQLSDSLNNNNNNNSNNSSNIGNSNTNDMADTSLSMISNSMASFDFDGGQGSSFYAPYMDFVTNFDAPTNFDTPTTFNPTPTFEPPTPKPSSNPNETVPESITNDIVEALLSPANCFTRAWPKRDSAIKYCSMIASQMDDKIAASYFDSIINGTNTELFIIAGRVFLLNSNLKIFEYACKSLGNYITNFNTNYSNQGMTDKDLNVKIDFFLKILMPSVWRIQGNNRVGLILMDGILKCITKKTPKKLFDTIIDLISYIYLKLELFNEKSQIIQSAENLGFSREMLSLLNLILPSTP